MLMNFETNDKYCFCSFYLLFLYFCSNICTNLLFFEIGCCRDKGIKKTMKGFLFEGSSFNGSKQSQLMGQVQPGARVKYDIIYT
jgi:hypothetical protein